jgi:hypothetical protein
VALRLLRDPCLSLILLLCDREDLSLPGFWNISGQIQYITAIVDVPQQTSYSVCGTSLRSTIGKWPVNYCSLAFTGSHDTRGKFLPTHCSTHNCIFSALLVEVSRLILPGIRFLVKPRQRTSKTLNCFSEFCVTL